ncbi:cytochrome P450 4C1-like [Wyeomyia smithii]|uniref:cytochrome P450 4C1-like n=1 Tax=Wyeomyia smithii TaxID=174621 RepID=UPI002467D4FE|nr:cytochrome P450 4C1-like [Wyeomyia smithii]
MIQWIQNFLCFVCVLLLVVHVLQTIDKQGRLFRALNKFAGPPVRPIIGTLSEVLFLDQAKTFQRARLWPKRYGGSYRFWGSRRMCVLNIVRVREAEPLLASVKNTDKSRFYKFLHPFLGLGLLNSAGSKWMHRRRILTPTFHFNILNGFHQTFLEECEQLLSTLSHHASSNKATDLRPLMSRFTLSTICETSMGVKLSSIAGADEYRQKLYRIGELLVYRLMRPWMHLDSICTITGYRKALNKLLRPVHAFTTSIINQRRDQFKQLSNNIEDLTEENIYTSTKKRYAMLDSLLLAEEKHQIDEEGIREEVDTFTFEGHDTTASALVFIFFTLAREQQVQERIYNEISRVHASKTSEGKWFTPQDYTEMKFMDRAIKECLRLWPPVPFISRAVTEDIILADGNMIPAGVVVNVHIFDLHRDPEQFPNPDEFDADRFLPENVDRRNPYAYVPFSAGPRNCVGQKYAMMELKAVVAHTLLQFKVLPVTHLEEINFVADLVLRSTNPIEVTFVARS